MAGLLERRHTVRRALAGGVVLGAGAGLVVGVAEAAWALGTAGASFDGAREAARFVLALVMLLAGAGALVGIAEGLVAAAVSETAAALGDPRRDEIWKARLYTALAVPPVALVCGQIFAGPRARTIPQHDLLAIVIGVVALAAWFASVRLWQRVATERLPRAAAFALAVAAALGAFALYAVDQKVLVRLYPFFHLGLGALVFGAVELALTLVHLGLRRRAVALLQPRSAFVVACLALAAGATALGTVRRSRALRTVVLDTTAIAAPLVQRLHGPVAATTAAPLADVARAPLPEGPHLGAADVFLVTIDAMRADRLAERTAPNLTALAARGVAFDHAYAQVPHTSFSIATLLTGKYVYALSTLGLDAARSETLAEIMKRERYKTAAFFPPAVFTIDRERLKPMEDSSYGFEYVKYEFLDAARRTDQVIHFLEAEKPARAFVWVHYFEPHEPYELHPGHLDGARTAVERYDGEVHYVDAEVERLVAYLQKTRPHALVIVAADHGEEFGEHGGRYHGTTLYDEQVHVPLAFVPLDGALSPHRVDEPVGLVDVAPTILSLIGIVPSARMRGRDLGPWLLPASDAPPAGAHGPVFAEINQKKMILDGTHKLVCDLASDACNAFDLAADPGERKNRLDEPWAGTLRRRLDAWMVEEARYENGADGTSDADARTRKVLERARLGDKTAATELAPLVTDPSLRVEATRLLATLPPEPKTRAALAAVSDARARTWADVALTRLGDDAARARLVAALPRLCADAATGADADEACARAALATGDVPALARALDRTELEEPLQIALVHALGRSHDPRALDPLVIHLGQVRTRADTVDALAELDDARALPTLLRWVPNEPYVPARARMVKLVAELGRHAPTDARAVLATMAASEREAPVMAALLPALAALGDGEVVDLSHERARALAGGELWLAGSGSGTVDVTVGGGPATALPMGDGVGHAVMPRAGLATVRAVDGDAAPRLAFSRRAP